MHWQTRASQYCWSVQLFMASQPRGVPSMAAEREESGYGAGVAAGDPALGTPVQGDARCASGLG